MKKFAAVIFLAFSLYASFAYACAMFERAEPRVGNEIEQAPPEVVLYFSDKIIIHKSEMKVVDEKGGIVSAGKAFARDEDAMAIKLKPNLKAGKYTVTWNALCDCGSYTPGHYKFAVTGK